MQRFQHREDALQRLQKQLGETRVKELGLALQSDPQVFLTNEILNAPPSPYNQEESVIQWAIQQNPYLLGLEPIRNNEKIVSSAVYKNPACFQYASDELKNSEAFVSALVKHSPDALQFASEAIKRNQEAVLNILQTKPECFEHISPKLKDNPTFITEAIQANPLVLEYASEAVKNDEAIVLPAVQKNGSALEFASPTLRDNPEIVNGAVNNYGPALRFAGEACKNNRDIVLAAVKAFQGDDVALQYASPGLRQDRDIVLAAVKKNSASIQYADVDDTILLEALQVNPEAFLSLPEKQTDIAFIKEAVKKNPEVLRQVSPEVPISEQDILDLIDSRIEVVDCLSSAQITQAVRAHLFGSVKLPESPDPKVITYISLLVEKYPFTMLKTTPFIPPDIKALALPKAIEAKPEVIDHLSPEEKKIPAVHQAIAGYGERVLSALQVPSLTAEFKELEHSYARTAIHAYVDAHSAVKERPDIQPILAILKQKDEEHPQKTLGVGGQRGSPFGNSSRTWSAAHPSGGSSRPSSFSSTQSPYPSGKRISPNYLSATVPVGTSAPIPVVRPPLERSSSSSSFPPSPTSSSSISPGPTAAQARPPAQAPRPRGFFSRIGSFFSRLWHGIVTPIASRPASKKPTFTDPLLLNPFHRSLPIIKNEKPTQTPNKAPRAEKKEIGKDKEGEGEGGGAHPNL